MEFVSLQRSSFPSKRAENRFNADSRKRIDLGRYLSLVRLVRVTNSKNRKCDAIFGGHDEALNADVEEKQIAVGPKKQDVFFRISHSETMITHCSTYGITLSKHALIGDESELKPRNPSGGALKRTTSPASFFEAYCEIPD